MTGQGGLWKEEEGCTGLYFRPFGGPLVSQISASSDTGPVASESRLLLVMLGWLERAVQSIFRLHLFLSITCISTGSTVGSPQEAR